MSTSPVKISAAEEQFAKSVGCKVELPEGVVWSIRGSNHTRRTSLPPAPMPADHGYRKR